MNFRRQGQDLKALSFQKEDWQFTTSQLSYRENYNIREEANYIPDFQVFFFCICFALTVLLLFLIITLQYLGYQWAKM